MRGKNSKERNQCSNNNGIKNIRSIVHRSLGMDTTSVFKSSSSSQTLKYSGIGGPFIPGQKVETIEIPTVPSIYKNKQNSSFSTPLLLFNKPNSNSSPKHVDHGFDVTELKNMQEDISGLFSSTESNNLNISEITDSDNDENAKSFSFRITDEDKEICSLNFQPREKTFISEANIFHTKTVESNENKHICPHCLKSFRFLSKLRRHINTHKVTQNNSDGDKVLSMQRDVCEVLSYTKNNFNVSEITNSDNNENSQNSSSFRAIHEGKRTCSSSILSGVKSFISESATFPPKSIKSKGKKHVCPHCQKSFRFLSKLKEHINTHNINLNDDENETSVRSVSLTEKSFGSETSDFLNVPHNQKDEQCPDCSKSFKCPSKLLRHIKTHVGVKPFKCHLCPKAFLEKFNLTVHIRFHRKEQPYICSKCERAFTTKSNLNRHMSSHLRQEQFTCSKCEKTCCSEGKLAVHSKTHEEIPHKCSECGREFSRKSNLKRHLKIHFNKREHPCNLCDYRAGQNDHLERHIQRKHAK